MGESVSQFIRLFNSGKSLNNYVPQNIENNLVEYSRSVGGIFDDSWIIFVVNKRFLAFKSEASSIFEIEFCIILKSTMILMVYFQFSDI